MRFIVRSRPILSSSECVIVFLLSACWLELLVRERSHYATTAFPFIFRDNLKDSIGLTVAAATGFQSSAGINRESYTHDYFY